MKRFKARTPWRLGVAAMASGIVLATAGVASADRIAPITFEPSTFVVGTIDGQQGWMKTGSYDVTVAPVASFAAASGYGFGVQALRISDALASGSLATRRSRPGSRARPASRP